MTSGQADAGIGIGLWRRFPLFFLKLGVAAALVAVLFRQQRINLRVFSAIRPGPVSYGLAALGCAGVLAGLLLMAWRLRFVLAMRRFRVSFGDSLRLTFVGSFIGAVLPGLIGGDAVKAAFLCGQIEERRMDAAVAVMVDRAIGLYALFVLGSLASLLGWLHGKLDLPSSVLLASPMIAGGGGVIAALLSWEPVKNSPRVVRLLARIPRTAQEILTSFGSYLGFPCQIFAAIAISLLNHALVVASFVCAGALISDSLSLSAHFIVDPIAMATNAIPLTPGGIGVAESAFSLLYGSAGFGDGAVVGLLGRVLQYFVFAISGVPAFLSLRTRIRGMTRM